MSGRILAGWGRADITPRGGPIALVGQWEERVTQKVRDPIFAVAMVLQSDAGRTIWVACDLVSISKALSDAVKERLTRSLAGFAASELVLSATHIHTGPNTDLNPVTSLLDGETDPRGAIATDECRRQVADAIERAVLVAVEGLDESSFEMAYSQTITGVNRRATYRDGSAQMYGDVHRSDFAGMEGRDGGPMQVIYVRRTRDDTITGVIAAVPCTAQADEAALYVTADYWATARQVIREGMGAHVHVLGLIRSAGDLSPHRMVDRARHLNRLYGEDGAQIMGRRVGEAVIRAQADVFYRAGSDAPHAHLCTNDPLPVWTATDEQYAWAKEYLAGKDKGGVGPLDDMMAYSSAVTYVKRYESGMTSYPCNLHAVRIGDIVLMTNPFELFIEYADRIRMAHSDAIVVDVELAGDECLGYLATQKAIDGGGYSSMVFSGITHAGGGDRMVRTSIEMIEKIMDE